MAQIKLKKKEIKYLNTFVSKGSKKARALTRARVLLLSNKGKKDAEIQESLAVGRSTIWRVKNNYLNKGIEYALTERDRPGQPVTYDLKRKQRSLLMPAPTLLKVGKDGLSDCLQKN